MDDPDQSSPMGWTDCSDQLVTPASYWDQRTVGASTQHTVAESDQRAANDSTQSVVFDSDECAEDVLVHRAKCDSDQRAVSYADQSAVNDSDWCVGRDSA